MVFIPEVWEEAILDYAERQFRIKNQVTNVSDIASGDTIHVPRVSEESAATLSSGSAVTFGASGPCASRMWAQTEPRCPP